MHDFPNLKEDIKEAEQDIRSGKYKTYTRLDDILHVSNRIKAKRIKK